MYMNEISSEKITSMAAEAARRIDQESYEKGKVLYNGKRVKWVKVFGPRIYSSVHDGKMHTVTIHIDDFSQSTCTCARNQLCEHIAAVFLHFYEPWLMANEILPNIRLAAGKNPPSSKSPGRAKNPVPIPVMEGPVEHWHEYFECEYRRLRASNRRLLQAYSEYFPGELYFTARQFNDFIGGISLHSKSWPSFNKEVYHLHGSLFFMTRLEGQVKNAKLSYMDSCQIDKIENSFMQSLSATLSCKQWETYQPFFQKAVEMVREALFHKKNPLFGWLLVYRLMCVTFYDSRELWEKEKSYLEEFMAKLDQNQQSYYFAALGLASLNMPAGRIDAAMALLRKLKKKRIGDMLFYLEYLAGAKEWEKLLVWLRWLAPGAKNVNPAVLEDICGYCTLAARNSDAGEEFIQLVRSWLPRSFDSYADYLLETGLFREWAELHIGYQEYTWESINKSALRHLESRDPAALLPLYHQWAARLIEEKNRKAYREAVKLLKKLRTLYNRQKMAGEWNAFISRLASHYSRMRAFQEELRKGKLISS